MQNDLGRKVPLGIFSPASCLKQGQLVIWARWVKGLDKLWGMSIKENFQLLWANCPKTSLLLVCKKNLGFYIQIQLSLLQLMTVLLVFAECF